MKKILVIQHVPYEGLAAFASVWSSETSLRILNMWEEAVYDILALAQDYDALVLMGGPMSANDEDKYPYLNFEIKLIEAFLKKSKAILGFCLGAQLIAKTLGAPVYVHPKKQKEIGWYQLDIHSVAENDLLFKYYPKPLKIFQWHGETFDLPEGAQCLASSRHFPNQAFKFRDNIYALQFHPEINLASIQEWLLINKHELDYFDETDPAARILAESQQQLKATEPLAETLARAFLKLC